MPISINLDNLVISDYKLKKKCFVKLEKLSDELIANETRHSRIDNETLVKKRKRIKSKRIDDYSPELAPPPIKRISNYSSSSNMSNYNTNASNCIELIDESANSKNWSRKDFSFGKKVGHGRFGLCYLVKEHRSKFQGLFVLKILDKKLLIENNAKDSFKQEFDNQYRLNHPNILKLHGWFDEPKKLYLILEYAPNGDLYSRIKDKSIDNALAAKYVYQTTKALIYLHSHNIIHRDLKPENLLIGYFDEIKLADFGWSLNLSPNSKAKCLAGTVDYLCPEMIEHKPHNYKVDNWCLGVLCYELLVGKAPFFHNDKKETYQAIKQINYSKDKIPNLYARNLIDSLLRHNSEERLQLNKVITHEWIELYADKKNDYEKYSVNTN